MQYELPVTALVAARNEEVNMARCLAALAPARRVVVLDSHSTDATGDIARRMGAEVVQFDYRGGYPKKRQWALDNLPIDTAWALLVDADEVIPAALWDEIGYAMRQPGGPEAYLIRKGFHFLGRRFKYGGFSHEAVLLFRTGCARFETLHAGPEDAQDMEIHERLLVDGRVGRLRVPLIHEDFKGLEAYIARHNHYSSWEARVRARYLQTGRWGSETVRTRLWGNVQERRRFLKMVSVRAPFEPQLWFLYHYFARLGFLEGKAGLIASRLRAFHFSE